MFTTRFQKWVRRRAQRLAQLLRALPLTPNQITVAGTAATFVAAGLAAFGHLLFAGIVLAISGTFDILDGALARASNRSYPYGAFLDSTMDRYSEGAMYVGLAAYFVGVGGPWMRLQVLACFCALAGSFLVSYVRARAQSLGFRCDSGLFARPERVVVTVVGLLLGDPWLTLVVVGLAVLTNFTALQRVNEVWQQARQQRRAAREGIPQPATGGGKTTAP